VYRIKKDGTDTVDVLDTGDGPFTLSVGDGSVFWTDKNQAYRCALPACDRATPIAQSLPSFIDMLADAPNKQLFFAKKAGWNEPVAYDDGALLRMMLPGGAPSAVISPPSNIVALTKNTTSLIALRTSTSDASYTLHPDGAVLRISLTGTAAIDPLLTGLTMEYGRIAVGPDSVYLCGHAAFAGQSSRSSGVWRIPLRGGVGSTTPPILAPGLERCGAIALDERHTYWAPLNGIARCPSAGCQGSFDTVTGGSQVDAIALDDQAIYWVANANASRVIMRRAK
jgi:hypothetical protein